MRPGEGRWAGGEYPAFSGKQPSQFELKRAFKPHRCKISDRVIYPCEKAWCKTFYHYYNGKVAFEEWICEEEMVFAKLKGEKL